MVRERVCGHNLTLPSILTIFKVKVELFIVIHRSERANAKEKGTNYNQKE